MIQDNSLLLVIPVIAIAIFVIFNKKKSKNTFTIPSGWGFQHSSNIANILKETETGFQFTFPEKDGIHYLTNHSLKGSQSINATVRLDYEGSPEYEWNRGNNTSQTPANFGLYFQRKGDNLSGSGDYQYYRWWSKKRVQMKNGVLQLSADLMNPAEWTSVYGKSGADAPDLFKKAVEEMDVVGFTFGGGSFYGHGFWVKPGSGKVTFILTDFLIN